MVMYSGTNSKSLEGAFQESCWKVPLRGKSFSAGEGAPSERQRAYLPKQERPSRGRSVPQRLGNGFPFRRRSIHTEVAAKLTRI
jgi:hypothetical protein